MRLKRFIVKELSSDPVHVSGDEASHALRVLRMGIGDHVILFDGYGREAQGRIVSASADAFEATKIGPVYERRSVDVPLILAVACPKGERADWLIEKCAELGIAAVRFLETRRGQVQPGEGKLTRLRRKAAEAAKQAGHARLMDVEGPITIHDAIGREPLAERLVLYGDPSIETFTLLDAVAERRASGMALTEALIVIGPEGGLTDEERAAIECTGGRAVRLADSVLRVETAAVAAAAVWACFHLHTP